MTESTDKAEGFSEDWLTLREPADHAARSVRLTDELAAWAKQQSPLQCLELGAGTGSNLRYLCPLLGHDQRWILIDNDPDLLTHIPRLIESWASHNHCDCHTSNDELILRADRFSARISWLQKDVVHNLAKMPFHNTQLVCASALLDLTSAAWLEQLASLCVENQCAAMFVINYNGKIDWHPSLAEDQFMNDLLNAHQLSDKGFGKALGPQGGSYFGQLLEEHGRRVLVDDSNWELNPDMSELQLDLIEGWAPAAMEQDSSKAMLINSWSEQRVKACLGGESWLTVGHSDLLSLPVVSNAMCENSNPFN